MGKRVGSHVRKNACACGFNAPISKYLGVAMAFLSATMDVEIRWHWQISNGGSPTMINGPLDVAALAK